MDETAEVMKRAKAAFEASGITLDELGRRMGAAEPSARMTAWQFLNKTTDPRLSMVFRFCEAISVPPEKLLAKKKKKQHSA